MYVVPYIKKGVEEPYFVPSILFYCLDKKN
jgi:hypothetical protein